MRTERRKVRTERRKVRTQCREVRTGRWKVGTERCKVRTEGREVCTSKVHTKHSKQGAHNQRGEVTVQLRNSETVWIEDVIELIESSSSSELYSLLKRPDEKYVTERAFENPVFVEDLVRNVAVLLNKHPHVTWYKVEAENFESIHNHNAYACIEKG